MTKQNLGKTKLDSKGYIVTESWEGGYPFPRPSGPMKAQQIMYNVEKRYLGYGQDFFLIGRIVGFTKNLNMDFNGAYEVRHLRLWGRAMMKPYGVFDQRAKEKQEVKTFAFSFDAPRDIAGAVESALYYLDPSKPDSLMIYLPSMRRVRKMTSSDTQDPIMGQDQIIRRQRGMDAEALS